MEEHITKSYEETLDLASSLAKRLPVGSTLAFIGGLGAGKTAFTTGFVKGLGIEAEVSSPTFAVCNVYRSGGKEVLHYDMYRIEGWDDLYSIGFFDSTSEDSYTVIEWSENIYNALDEGATVISIEKLSENERKIKIMNKREADIELGISD